MHRKCPPRRLPFAPPQALSADVDQLAAHEEAVRDMLSTIFDQVSAPQRWPPIAMEYLSSDARCAQPSSTRCDIVPRHASPRAHASAHHGAPSPTLSPQVISYQYHDTHEDIHDIQPKLWTALGPLIQLHLKVR